MQYSVHHIYNRNQGQEEMNVLEDEEKVRCFLSFADLREVERRGVTIIKAKKTSGAKAQQGVSMPLG